MKVQTTVITKLGSYSSDISENVDEETVELARDLLRQASNLEYFCLVKGGKTIYFPREVISQSILILDVIEAD